ncbi:MAG: TIGR02099 family protein [Rhizobacter sp.]
MSSLPSAPKVLLSRRWAGWWPPLRHGLRWFVRLGLGVLVAVWGLLLLAWLSLHWLILPHLERWRDTLETHASKALGVSVKLGHIQVRSSGWVPSIELRDVQLLDKQGRVALTLPLVTAAVSPQSLLHLDLRFDQLIIDGAQMEVRRDKQGHVFIAGWDLRLAHPNSHVAQDWLFKQHEVVVRGGSVQWVDELRDAPPLALTDVQLVVRNSLRRHHIRFDATPPASWGQRFSLRGRFTQPLLARPGDWRRWTGAGHLDMPQADISELRRYVALPFEIQEGQGGLRAWAQLKSGALESATLDVALRAVGARLAPGLEPLRLEQVAGRLIGKRHTRPTGSFSNKAGQQELELAGKGLSFATHDGLVWPSSDFSFKVQQHTMPDGQVVVTGGELRAPQMNLGVLSDIGSRLPVGSAVNKLLQEAQPQGEMTGLMLSWQGPLDAPTAYQARARVTGLSLVAKPSPEEQGVGRPGIVGANVDVEATQAGGSSKVTLDAGRLLLPGVFSDPVLAFDQFSANVQWRVEKVPSGLPQVIVKWNQVRFANADMQGEVSGQWRTGEGLSPMADSSSAAVLPVEVRGKGQRLPGHLLLDGRLTRGDAAKISRYLPQKIPEKARDYLRRALNQGRISEATVRVQGDLAAFPFVHVKNKNEGEFRFAGKVQGATFAYVPDMPAHDDVPAWTSPWPALTDVQGEVVIYRDQLDIRNAQAKVMGVSLSKVNGEIRDLGQKGKTSVRIDGQGRGELSKMVNFVNTSPVGAWIGQALAGASVSGNSDLNLRLNLPIFDFPASTVQGSVDLLGNDLRLRADLPLLADARGRVNFSHQGFSLPGGIVAKAIGGEVTVTGGSQADHSVRLSGSGMATAEGLQATTELGTLARWATHFGGQTRYQLDVGVAGGRTEIDLRSDLVGWSSQLPDPLRKTALTSWPLSVQTRWSEDTQDASARTETVKVEAGQALQALYIREWPTGAGSGPARVLRGAVGLGVAAPPLPSVGVVAQAALQKLDADEWAAVLQPSESATTASSDMDLATAYSPTQWRVRADEIQTNGLRLTEVEASAALDRGEWRGVVNSQQAKGQLAWRPATAAQASRLFAHLSRLSLGATRQIQPAGAASPTSTASSSTAPTLDVVVDDFELRGKKLGRLEVQAVNAASATRGGFDWTLQRLELTTPEARLSATGHWSAVNPISSGSNNTAPMPARQTEMDFTLNVSDAGALLERLGQPQTVRGGKGELVGQLRWRDSPLNPDPLSMSGHMKVDIGAGQFLRQDPGAARLLGVLSLQALPRRLLFDFRDLFQEGFAFDSVTGDVDMRQGVASTNNLRMRGVQAVVLMEGQASLQNETQDLRVYVVPEINAGTASLAYAVINPALGLGTFLAQMFLRKPLAEANTREFRVTGPWADPKVERVQRSPPPPDSASSEPNSAPAAASPRAAGPNKP